MKWIGGLSCIKIIIVRFGRCAANLCLKRTAINNVDLVQLNIDILSCSACTIRNEARKPVPGVGNFESKVLFIGRNPGSIENEKGSPFIGPAGKVLNTIFLPACGLQRSDVFITNLVLCYTVDDREPPEDTVSICTKLFLKRLWQMMLPKVVVTFGKLTARTILGVELKDSCGVFYTMHNAIVIPCMHPGAVLYRKKLMTSLLEDAVRVKGVVESVKEVA